MATVGRVRDRATFESLRQRGHRSRAGAITLTWLPSDGRDQGPPRVAYAVGRSVGSAVRRNRVRRRLRAVVAEVAPRMAAGTYLVAASERVAEADIGVMREMMGTALRGLRGAGDDVRTTRASERPGQDPGGPVPGGSP